MRRTIILGGREIVISALGQPIDIAFDGLHAAYLGQLPLPWEEFEKAAQAFFDSTPANWSAHDAYFNNFTVIWRNFLNAGNFAHAEHIWQRALQPAQRWEEANPTQRIHKGTPYYFWSMTALLRGHVDRGYLLIHRAVQEDIETHQKESPKTPGYALVSLDYTVVDQAFRQWVAAQAEFLGRLLDNYNTTYGRTLPLGDAKRRFFDAPPTADTVFLLTYTLARLMQLTDVPDHVARNPFAGQLELNLLFDVTLVIDSAIKAKNPSKWKFIDHAECLLNAAGHAVTKAQLREINDKFENDFDATLRAALDGSLSLQDGTLFDRVISDVALAYGLRNYGAHNTATASTVWNRFPEVQQGLFRALFTTVDYLY
jgi:hypothetical protein